MKIPNPVTRRYHLPYRDKIKPTSPAANCFTSPENTGTIACLPDAVLTLFSPHGEAAVLILPSARVSSGLSQSRSLHDVLHISNSTLILGITPLFSPGCSLLPLNSTTTLFDSKGSSRPQPEY